MVFEKPFTPYLAAVAPGPTFLVIRELPPEELVLFHSHSKVVIGHYRDCSLFLAAVMNYNEYVKLLNTYSEQCSINVGKFPTFIGLETMALNINRHVLNLLTTVRTFLDQTERQLKQRHGDNSDRVKAFKSETAKAYDESFSYRFLYKLRNFVQHCGLPLGRMTIHGEAEEDLRQGGRQTIDFEFSRVDLLSSFASWGEPVKSDLARLPEYFPMRPHVDELMKTLEKLQISQVLVNCPNVIGSLKWLDALLWEASWRGGRPIVGFRNSSPDVESDFSIEIHEFPRELMDMFRKPLEKLFGVGTAQFYA